MNTAHPPIFSLLFSFIAVFFLAACSVFAPGEPLSASAVPTRSQNGSGQAGSAPATLTPAPAPTDTPQPTQVVDYQPLSVAAPDCSYGGAFQSIESVDASTVRFSLCQPDVAFLSKIASPAFAVYPRQWLESAGRPGFELDQPPGAGPYRLSAWTPGEKLELVANAAYWRTPGAQIPQLLFRWDLDSSMRLVELQAGTADGIDNIGPNDYATVRDDPARVLLMRPALNVAYLGMNSSHAPFDDERVRQAVALALDRDRLVQEAFPAGYEVASHFTPCTIPHACAGEAWGGGNPEQARNLLSEAGLASGFTVELAYRDVVRGYLPYPKQVAEAVREQLKQVLNVSVRLRAMDEEEFYSVIDSGEYPGLYLLGWGADYPDVDNFLATHFGPRASRQFGDPFPDVNEAITRGASTVTDDARQAAYADANAGLRRHIPMVPLAHGGWFSPYSLAVAYTRIEGAHASPLGLEDFSRLASSGKDQFVWLQAAEPSTLYCGFAQDIETLRACSQIADMLYRYKPGEAAVEPALAEDCTPDESLQVWTCRLRSGLAFQDGSPLDAGDVVASFAAQWQSGSALHALQPDGFAYFKQYWGAFLP